MAQSVDMPPMMDGPAVLFGSNGKQMVGDRYWQARWEVMDCFEYNQTQVEIQDAARSRLQARMPTVP